MVKASGGGGTAAIFEKNKNGYLIGAATGGLTDTTGARRALRDSDNELLRQGGDLLASTFGTYETTPSVVR